MEELRIEANGNLGPIDSSRIPRYAGAATYARLPRLDQVAKADVTVVGVPFDSGVSYRPGARFGSNHIREASGPGASTSEVSSNNIATKRSIYGDSSSKSM